MDQIPNRPGDIDRSSLNVPSTEGKTHIGSIDYNLAGVIAYVPILMVDVVSSILWLRTEPKSNKFLRFHSMQSLLLFGVYLAIASVFWFVNWILSFMSFLSWMVVITDGFYMLFTLVFIITKAVIMAQAYKGQMPMLPYIGPFADSNS
jgi:uncharacterized membrane protein